MINVTKTYIPDIEKYQAYLQRIFRSGWLTNNGEFVQELERKLADYLEVEYVIPVANGTLALEIAYKLLDLKGDVLTTPFTFVATTSSLVWSGLNPVFCDIDRSTFNIDPDAVRRNITPQSSAVLPVHVFGNICEAEKIEDIARSHNLKLIYDASHAFGIKYKSSGSARLGDISVISFHSSKIFHTIEGGAIIVKDRDTYDRAKLMINFGIPGPDRITALGINCKMNEFEAAMGLCVLDAMDYIISERKKIHDYYCEQLKGNDTITFQKMNSSGSQNYAYFPVVFTREEQVLRIISDLNKKNIYPRRYFYPSLDKLSYVKPGQSVPASNYIADRILCLPIYETLALPDVGDICEVINQNS